ncbi:V-type ATP synthase subunit D [Peptoniphilus stercorisuis]|uniref:V-type ATP synthase subunit D n=1 Tax=Peptoniphilus stercorisuis TaxID=1436965 RepID=A0ABS4KA35_9FIRM|nr:V-type ATP synthase subunit D [Peptoniphilus stercorisuis]MBP2024629.1 V/A-type H+-transporting ATPase subunit D [Peptoniphilus stercorisuis]
MAKKIVPTKANLIATKSALNFAKKGYDLLDKKRTVLIKEMMDLNKRAMKLQEVIEKTFEESYTALEDATITMGSESMYEIAKSTPKEKEYEIISRSVMGVEIPEIKYEKEGLKTEYSIHKTTTAFDEATVDMINIEYLIYELAQVETSVFRLAQEIKKTQKRANALDKIQIPKYTDIVNEIENILAEKEREDFFRLKKVKDRKEKQELEKENQT